MNKGVILEVNNDTAMIMSEDGRFLRVKTFAGAYQGMEMVYSDMDIVRTKKSAAKLKMNFNFRFSQLAAAVVLGFALLSGSYIYYDYNYAVYASVSLDVNPSMQLDIGKRSQVVKVEELNTDAENLLEGLKLEGQPVDEVITEVENRLQEKGYFTTEKENCMLLGYTNVNGKMDMKQLQNTVQDSAVKEATAKNISLKVKSVNADPALVREAKKTNEKVSAGRQTYINKLKSDGIIDANTDASTAKLPALFASDEKANVDKTTLVTTVTPTPGDASVTVTVTDGLTVSATPTPTVTAGTPEATKEPAKALDPATATGKTGSDESDAITTITVIPNDKITITPTPTEKGDKTNDNNKYKGNVKQSVTKKPTVTPTPTGTPLPTVTPAIDTGKTTESIDPTGTPAVLPEEEVLNSEESTENLNISN